MKCIRKIPVAVSYTHLDVYKRQEQISAFKKNVTGRVIPKSERERLEIFERMLSGMQAQEDPQIGRTETDFYRNSAVSYTHLDVYKRQGGMEMEWLSLVFGRYFPCGVDFFPGTPPGDPACYPLYGPRPVSYTHLFLLLQRRGRT